MWHPVSTRNGLTTSFVGRNTGLNGWQDYVIPKGALFLDILGAAGGGGGGNGFGAAAGAARGGGGGGGSSALARLFVPTSRLPEVLYIYCGHGGTATLNGGPTRVGVNRGTAAADLILVVNQGNGGGTGTGAAAGAAGTAGAIATATSAMYQNLGVVTWTVGQAGAAGGVHTGAAGGSVTFGAVGIPLSGGAGGAGCTATEFAGGNITGAGLVTTISGGALGANPGQAGRTILRPLTYTGGSGAGSSNTVAGARGGDGAPGCGGGGGGAGVTTGGTGGTGGPGFVIITAVF